MYTFDQQKETKDKKRVFKFQRKATNDDKAKRITQNQILASTLHIDWPRELQPLEDLQTNP
jgi:hypothetical protein